MTTSDLAPVVALHAAPVTSLTELRTRHSALLQRLRDPEARPSSGEILGFLEAASALGRLLDDENFSERESAQSVMDYWVATLISQAPQVTEGSRPFSLAEYDPAGGEAMLSDSQRAGVRLNEAAGHGKVLAQQLSEPEQKLLERLLLRFVRLKERSLAPYLVPLLDTDDILSEPGVRPLLKKLHQTGLLDHRESAAGSPSSWVLLHEDLLVKWDFLRQTVTSRKAFRELANGWHNTGRNEGALLSRGPQLDQASLYRDCNETEEAFRAASSAHVLNHERSKIRITRIALAVSVMVMAAMGFLLYDTHRLNNDLVETQLKKESATDDYEVANKEAHDLAATALQRSEERDKLLTQIADLRQQVARLSAVTTTTQTSAQILTRIKTISADLDRTTKDSTAKIADPDDRTLRGPIKTFGRDGARPDEGLALIRNWTEADRLMPKLFLPDVPRVGTPLVAHLDPTTFYVAARWDYSVTSRRWLLSHKVRVKNPATGVEHEAQPVDWGPNVATKCVMDLSPGLARALGLVVNQEAELTIPPIDPVTPSATGTPSNTGAPIPPATPLSPPGL